MDYFCSDKSSPNDCLKYLGSPSQTTLDCHYNTLVSQAEIVSKEFKHGKRPVTYKFQCNLANLRNITNKEMKDKLNSFKDSILSNSYPIHIFNNELNPRASNFILKGTSSKNFKRQKGVYDYVYYKLIIKLLTNARAGEFGFNRGFGKIPETNNQEYIKFYGGIVDSVKRALKIGIYSPNYQEIDPNFTLDDLDFGVLVFNKDPESMPHPIVQNYCLKNVPYTILSEIPIFLDTRLGSYFSGHIDLLFAKNNDLIVSDFKPNSKSRPPNYDIYRSLPQVAIYGLILNTILKPESFKIKCLSFNDQVGLLFEPDILTKEILSFVKEENSDPIRVRFSERMTTKDNNDLMESLELFKNIYNSTNYF